jgi:hypothetical protein
MTGFIIRSTVKLDNGIAYSKFYSLKLVLFHTVWRKKQTGDYSINALKTSGTTRVDTKWCFKFSRNDYGTFFYLSDNHYFGIITKYFASAIIAIIVVIAWAK